MKRGICFALLLTTLLLAGCLPSGPRIEVTNNTSIPVIVGIADAKGTKRTLSLSAGEKTSYPVDASSYRATARVKADYSKELMSARDYLIDKLKSLERGEGYTNDEYDEVYSYIEKIDQKVSSMLFSSEAIANLCGFQIEVEGDCENTSGTDGFVEVIQSPNGALNAKCHLEAFEHTGCSK